MSGAKTDREGEEVMENETGKETKEERTLEDIFSELDCVIRTMEQGDISLEEAFLRYREGMELLKICNEKIDKIEKKMLILDDKGEEHEFEH